VPPGGQPLVETATETGTGGGGYAVVWLVLMLVGAVLLVSSVRGCGTTTTKPPSNTQTTSTVDLRASVNFTGTQFVIANGDTFAWTNVVMKVNSGFIASGFVLRTSRMEAGQTYTVGALQFAKDDGTRLDPLSTKPKEFSITADTPRGTGWWFGGWD
jgi:hypothetical protein